MHVLTWRYTNTQLALTGRQACRQVLEGENNLGQSKSPKFFVYCDLMVECFMLYTVIPALSVKDLFIVRYVCVCVYSVLMSCICIHIILFQS